ncbi:pre-mRNA-splicing factor 38 [Manduca sexta]|uniref:Pre-mRNA-splicing factor 38 n=1 Tax=Manduca sexta TaxID=7130 RepID=A0A922CWK3_MANSE|nr:pre-mRNA-splicing factor 38 [Manduca sexta]KAG6460566.1 hypothetical protein O3G_MSEX012066 [Manduca sexta]
MANRTVKDAKSIRGTNPQYLIEKIIRSRIYDSKYWKEECFALTAELLVDKAMELRYIGGVHGGFIYPTPFLCLVLKMLQIQPEKDIVVEFIKNEEFKYVRALGAFYMRLTGTSVDCYKYLEPLYNDNRKLRRQTREGQFEIVHVDEFIDELLREERLCDIILPRIQKRPILEENNELEPKVSALDDDLDEEMASDEDNADPDSKENKRDKERRDRDRRRERSRDRERREKDRKRDRSRSRDRDRRRDREREREREREKEREREREKERDRERLREQRERDREKERRDRDRHEADRRRDRGRY